MGFEKSLHLASSEYFSGNNSDTSPKELLSIFSDYFQNVHLSESGDISLLFDENSNGLKKVHIEFADGKKRFYDSKTLNITFQPSLGVPLNCVNHPEFSPYFKVDDNSKSFWVSINNSNGTAYNCSPDGFIEYCWGENYASFSPKRWVYRAKFNEWSELLKLQMSGLSSYARVNGVSPMILLSDNADCKYDGAILGDGALDTFFKHMQYQDTINSILL